MKYLAPLCLIVLLSGCAKSQVEPNTAANSRTESEGGNQSAAPAEDKDPRRGNIEISDRIRTACGISETDAYFAFNSAAVSSKANDVLKKLSTCFTTGPLAGTPIRLIGHADPRGDDEYNMVLGERRADNVKNALVRLGSSSDQLTTTSRGEMDASGTDESSWARDRKVQVVVAD